MTLFSFEKLVVWQESRQLAVSIYKTTKSLTKHERFGLVSQMRPYSVSILSKIAEEAGRHSSKDKARFTKTLYSLELLNRAILCHNLEFISESNYQLIREKLSKTTAMLDGLYKSLLKN